MEIIQIKEYIKSKLITEKPLPKIEIKAGQNNFNISIKYKQIKRNILSITITIGKRWNTINNLFVLGGIETLLKKIFKNYKTDYSLIENYDNFIKYISDLEPVKTQDPILKRYYDKINLNMFNNTLGNCSLKWGRKSKRTLGTYNLVTNTITISSSLQKLINTNKEDIVKYVIYHEMLHKALKFKGKTRKIYHSKEFRELEKRYPNANKIEQEIQKIIKTL